MSASGYLFSPPSKEEREDAIRENISCKMRVVLDQPYLFFRGDEDQTPPQKIRGHVKFTNTSTLRPKHVALTLEGQQRTSHYVRQEERDAGWLSVSPLVTTRPMIRQEQMLLDRDGEILTKVPPGENSYPFEIDVPGNLAETVEGIYSTGRFYGVRAYAKMPPFVANLEAKRRCRIIRTIGTDMSNDINPIDVSGTWPDKLDYSISTGSRAVIFGDRLLVDFELTPLVPKLVVGKITFSLVEVQKIRTNPGLESRPELGLGSGRFWRSEREVYKQTEEVPEVPEELHPTLLEPMKKFRLTFSLPKSLSQCRQTIERGDWIQIKHNAHYSILLHNADGHISELKVHHSIRLFVSQNMPIGDEDYVDEPILPSGTTNLLESTTAAPPTYGSHLADLPVNPFVLPSESYTAINTPALRSGAATPGHSHRQDSYGTTPPFGTTPPHGPSGPDLEARLHALALQPLPEIPEGEQGDEPGTQTPPAAQYLEWNAGMLSRVPTYNTAARDHGPSSSARAADYPPTYAAATSRPSSRGHSPTALTPLAPAHVREV